MTAVAATLVIAALAAGGIGGAKPAKIIVGETEIEYGGGFSPKSLPEEKSAPIAFFLRGEVRNRYGFSPPALKKLRIMGDNHVEFDLKGRPVCRLSGRDNQLTPSEVRKQCGSAIIGTGEIEFGIPFPESTIPSKSQLLTVKGRASTLYAFAWVKVPVTASVVIPIDLNEIHRGRFGTEAIASLPKIAGGGGSVLYLKLSFKKGVLRATCPDGHLDARVTAFFKDGTKAPAKLTRPCTTKSDQNRRD